MMLDSPPNSNAVTLGVASLTLVGTIVQGVLAHLKGRRGKRDNTRVWDRIEHKLDGFIETQSVANAAFEARITNNEHRLTGVDGNNGALGIQRDHERRIRDLEGTPQRSGDVGLFQPPRRA